jgi:hypothetical protein
MRSPDLASFLVFGTAAVDLAQNRPFVTHRGESATSQRPLPFAFINTDP